MRTVLLTCLLLVTQAVYSVQITIDYSRDGSSLFDENSADGMLARAAVEAAADNISSLLTDTLDPISKPDDFQNAFSTHTWDYSLSFNDPASNSPVEIMNTPIAQDEILVFVGGFAFTGNTVANGSAGGADFTVDDGTNLFANFERDQINATTDALVDSLATRGEEEGFARWGGSVIFGSGQAWHLDHIAPVTSGEFDLYSVAMHELFHVLGFGAAEEWHALRQESEFIGESSVAEFGGPVPLYSADNGHWQEGITSPVFEDGSNPSPPNASVAEQETLMDPSISRGERKEITRLDAAGLEDIGWTLAVLIPEPTTLAMLSIGALMLAPRRVR